MTEAWVAAVRSWYGSPPGVLRNKTQSAALQGDGGHTMHQACGQLRMDFLQLRSPRPPALGTDLWPGHYGTSLAAAQWPPACTWLQLIGRGTRIVLISCVVFGRRTKILPRVLTCILFYVYEGTKNRVNERSISLRGRSAAAARCRRRRGPTVR